MERRAEEAEKEGPAWVGSQAPLKASSRAMSRGQIGRP